MNALGPFNPLLMLGKEFPGKPPADKAEQEAHYSPGDCPEKEKYGEYGKPDEGELSQDWSEDSGFATGSADRFPTFYRALSVILAAWAPELGFVDLVSYFRRFIAHCQLPVEALELACDPAWQAGDRTTGTTLFHIPARCLQALKIYHIRPGEAGVLLP